MKIKTLFCVFMLFMLTGCGRAQEKIETTTEITTETTTETTTQAPEERLLKQMTLHEKVGQLFIVTPEALNDGGTVTAVDNTFAENMSTYPVGGVILFSKNIENPQQLTELVGSMKACSAMPLFVAIDEEGGEVARLADNKSFSLPVYKSMTEAGRNGEAYSVGSTIGGYLSDYGFNLDFAPVADVNTNINNPIIGQRAFSSDPEKAAGMVGKAVQGFHSSGVLCCVKHFPGHGDTAQDSHKGYASTNKTWDELEECELLPFISGIENGADMVMAGHITAPNITSDGLPASLSKEMITGHLRDKMGYTGVVITDSMAMGAVAQYYTSAQAACMAINAGVDIILMPEDLEEAYNAVENAVNNGEISEDRLDESVLRVLKLKHIE